LGVSTSWNPQGLSRSVMGLLYLYFENVGLISSSYSDMIRSIIHHSAFYIIGVDIYEKLVVKELILISTHNKASEVFSEKLICY
jgi:hypothetical protein